MCSEIVRGVEIVPELHVEAQSTLAARITGNDLHGFNDFCLKVAQARSLEWMVRMDALILAQT